MPPPVTMAHNEYEILVRSRIAVQWRRMNRGELQILAEARVSDAEVLLQGMRWGAAYYLLGYAVECALKACAAKQFREHEVPEKTVVNDFYTHGLDRLLNISAPGPRWTNSPALTAPSVGTGTPFVIGASARAMIIR